ncbi:MAG: hypothetical protein QM483_04595 [Desulfuromusa sp.]
MKERNYAFYDITLRQLNRQPNRQPRTVNRQPGRSSTVNRDALQPSTGTLFNRQPGRS